jgi:monoamine oxidase
VAWELSRAGSDATVDFALSEMAAQLGSGVRRHFVKGMATDWATNPLTYGAYSALRPGAFGARDVLAAPLGGKLFFAGEAIGGKRSALVNGALESGRKTAKKIARQLER